MLWSWMLWSCCSSACIPDLTQEARGDGVLLLRVYRLEDKYKIQAAEPDGLNLRLH